MDDLVFECGTSRVRADATVEQCRRLYPGCSVRLAATLDDPPRFRVLVREVAEPEAMKPVRQRRARQG